MLRDFQIFLIHFRYIFISFISCFLDRFLHFLKSQFVDRFPVFFYTDSAYFRFVSCVWKKLLISVSLLFFRSISAYFRFVSGLKKSCTFLVSWLVSFFFNPFLQIIGPFSVFRKVINFQYVGQFPVFLSVSSNFWSVSGFQKKFKIFSLLVISC